jgi:ATP-dependent Lhr-like helicase
MLQTQPRSGFAFDPLVERWFDEKFGEPTAPQVSGWPLIAQGRDVLICAPTGSGKTLAAFLMALDRLVRLARYNELTDATHVVYVSPLKALVNDVHRNLEVPLAQINELAARDGISLSPIRVALRTGDSTHSERARMLSKRPHILVTTPESLFILLTAARSRELFRSVSTVIVDEIHAMVASKRGPHLALSLARLDRLVDASGRMRPQRVGLSATVKPVEEVARFLAGGRADLKVGDYIDRGADLKVGDYIDRGADLKVGDYIDRGADLKVGDYIDRGYKDLGEGAQVVNIGHRRETELSVWVPQDELGPVATNEMWDEIYDHLAELIKQNRTTLVFVSTRRLSERVAHNLLKRLGEGSVMPHHGSLARHIRLETERRLKAGELRAVVATASLELGIDIGSVDLAVQLGSPRSIAVALQRIGRSGHWVGARPKGVLIATTRDDLVECAALVRAIRTGAMDKIELCQAPLDILAQQIVAACAAEDWDEDELFALVRSTYPYRSLAKQDFEAVVTMLSAGVATARGRSGSLLHRAMVNHRLRGRRGARLAAITSGGAIPDTTTYAVVAEPEGTVVGTLDEDFAIESMSGDIFLLGTNSWQIRRVEQGRVRVTDAHGAPPTIPFWNGEGPGRTLELSEEVSRLRLRIARFFGEDNASVPAAASVEAAAGRKNAVEYLERECGVERIAAEQMIDYVLAGKTILGGVPSQDCVIAERFFDESGGMQLVLHAPFGSRINRAWGLALRKRFCRSFNLELQAAATDNGIVISLSEQHAFPLDVIFEFLKPATVEEVLTQAMLPSPMFTARWRWNAQRSLTILRFAGGRKVAAPIFRMKADDLLAAVFPDQAACPENLSGDVRIPDHPLVNETIANCLHEAMDLDGLKAILSRIEDGSLQTLAVDTAEPSMFSHEILNSNPFAYLDDAPLEERRARAVTLRATLRADAFEGAGLLDPEAIAQVSGEVWPVVRDADELHDALLTLMVLPPVPEWQEFFDLLASQNRATQCAMKCGAASLLAAPTLWVAAEKLDRVRQVYADLELQPPIRAIEIDGARQDAEAALCEIVRGWMESSGPLSAEALAEKLSIPKEPIESALLRLEHEGQVLRGSFTRPGIVEWCNRRVLARIHRLTLGRLRREIEPVSSAQYEEFLARWQHVAFGTQLHGVDGTLAIIKQLQGFEFPAEAWEREVLPRRVRGYKPEYLDKLCASGEVMWARLSPHPAFAEPEPHGRRVRPTRVAPVALFLRENAGWLVQKKIEPNGALSPPARDVLSALESNGASFFVELVSASGRLPSEVEDGLWELVAAGLVTADGFDNLRSLIDPKRRLALGRRNRARPRNAPGRWALLARREHSADAEAFARQLLVRWGVVARDIARRETAMPAWRDVLVALRRLEAHGEIRGGFFISSHIGEQFASTEAIELLRAVRRAKPTSGEGSLAS